MTNLTEALAHLRAFRATFDEGDVVDEESCLSADDLTWLIDVLGTVEDSVPASDPEDRMSSADSSMLIDAAEAIEGSVAARDPR